METRILESENSPWQAVKMVLGQMGFRNSPVTRSPVENAARGLIDFPEGKLEVKAGVNGVTWAIYIGNHEVASGSSPYGGIIQKVTDPIEAALKKAGLREGIIQKVTKSVRRLPGPTAEMAAAGIRSLVAEVTTEATGTPDAGRMDEKSAWGWLTNMHLPIDVEMNLKDGYYPTEGVLFQREVHRQEQIAMAVGRGVRADYWQSHAINFAKSQAGFRDNSDIEAYNKSVAELEAAMKKAGLSVKARPTEDRLTPFVIYDKKLAKKIEGRHQEYLDLMRAEGATVKESVDDFYVLEGVRVMRLSPMVEGSPRERVGEYVDLAGMNPKLPGFGRRLLIVASEMRQKLMNGAVFYISDPDGILKDKTHMGTMRQTMPKEMTFEPVKSPKTGKAGWRVVYAAGGEQVVPGADRRQAQIAYTQLTKALKGVKLDTSYGEKREVQPDEFMLMQIKGDGTAQFKHGFSRNYVFIDAKGKLTVPKTNEPFFKGYFDDADVVFKRSRDTDPEMATEFD